MDSAIHDALAALITLLISAYVLTWLVRRLGRSRPDLEIGTPVLVGFVLRVVAAAGVSLTSVEYFLRGPDEVRFTTESAAIAATNFGSSEWTEAAMGALYEFVFAAQIKLLDSPDLVLRISQSAIAMVGLVLLAVSVHELAGPRAGRIAIWLLALEPASIFFSSIIHKEPLMFLASGLVAYGSTMIWKQARPQYLAVIAAGCLVAVATRPYAGWFLIAAGAAAVLHAGLRADASAGIKRFGLVSIVVLLAAISAPTILEASTDENLERNVQASQDANTSDNANLSLESVDFSTRGAIITNLPVRIRDVLLRPYPWQVANSAQQLGALGGLAALALFALLVNAMWRSWGQIAERAGPLLYLAAGLLVAYSLSAGNAGTAFRYRTHVVAIVICAFAAIRYYQSRSEPAPAPANPSLDLPVASASAR